jgi:hypothetical protein
MTNFFIILGAILLALALPALIWEASLKRFMIGLFVAAFGVVLPLFTFIASAGLVPDWKGGCEHGWIDCFHQGKFALAPLVLWASAALYTVEVSRMKPPYRHWIGLGLFVGATVAGGCFVYGLLAVGRHINAMSLWLLVPFYVAAWHAIRSGLFRQPSKIKSTPYALAVGGSLPFWIGGAVWSGRIYDSLPNDPPGCFVVTAASRGHRNFVGPFVQASRNGRAVSANQQLLDLWRLEEVWRLRAPRSHAAFRRAYNRLGPLIARRIISPWVADTAYVALKPVEWLARGVVSFAKIHE